MDVGFIGLGNMGSAMARRLIKGGHRLTIYNRTRAKADELAADGALVAERPADACHGDAVITMLADDRAVEHVALGEGGFLAALGDATIHISMSTISVALSERLALEHARVHRGYVAAPVFGRPDAAAAGKLFIIAAGAGEVVGRCQVLFDAMGQKTFAVDENPPTANLIKLSGNFLITSIIESLGETFALTRKAGVDPHRFLEILTGTLFSGPIFMTYGGLIADEHFQPAGFEMSLGLKDIRLALAAADALLVPMPLASQIYGRMLTVVARGEGDTDWSALARLSARDAGLHS